MDIVGIAGDEVAAEPPVIGADPMDMVLLWIGFENEATRDLLRSEGLTTFVDLESMKEKDIRDLAESYGRRTINDGRFIFGVRRIKRLIGLIHWVQDFGRVSEEPSLDTFLADGGDAALFCRALDEAFQRADVRKVEKEQSDTVSKAADPGKFKDEKKWPEWEPAFVNYLSTIQGVNGVPLSYVVREQEEVDRNGTFESFNERTIACSPLKGPIFQADARKVHQLLKSFLQTETAEQWIKPLARKQSGRADMIALRKHYSGEGNTSRRIADAEKIRDNLYYKNERAMQFSAFLDKLQRMFNIFEEENEEVSEQAKVRMLLKKVEHPQLQDAVGALRVRAAIEGISFTECANHLSAQVSELPDQHTPRKVSATGSRAGKKDSEIKRIRGGGQSGKRNGIHMPDGSIWTGFYSDWEQLSKEDRQTVMDTRISNKAKGGRGKPGRKVSEVGSAKKLKEIKGQVAELKRTLASLKSSKDAGGTDESTDDDSTPDNAGDSFGGRQQKRAKTKN
ncbi:hypothetical protein MHU86_24134 [Fragilaria crotonensis]|nr:hypothetical protein MHU86_24134 [Fragilaria crotonensis]